MKKLLILLILNVMGATAIWATVPYNQPYTFNCKFNTHRDKKVDDVPGTITFELGKTAPSMLAVGDSSPVISLTFLNRPSGLSPQRIGILVDDSSAYGYYDVEYNDYWKCDGAQPRRYVVKDGSQNVIIYRLVSNKLNINEICVDLYTELGDDTWGQKVFSALIPYSASNWNKIMDFYNTYCSHLGKRIKFGN